MNFSNLSYNQEFAQKFEHQFLSINLPLICQMASLKLQIRGYIKNLQDFNLFFSFSIPTAGR